MLNICGKKGIREVLAHPERDYLMRYQEFMLSSCRKLEYPLHLPEDWTPAFEERRDLPYRPLYCASMERGEVMGHGNIISPDHFLIDDAVPNYNTGVYQDKFSLLNGGASLQSPQEIDGSVFVMSALYSDFYYHWLYHSVAKLNLLSSYQPDYFYVNTALPFQKQYLEMLGISKHRIIPATNDSYIRAKTLIFTAYLSLLNDYSISFLRSLVALSGADYKLHDKKIYISRNDAPNKRQLENEEAVFNFLHQEGFEKYELSHLTIQEQIKLFASASFVIGPHGAGIGNIVFCQEGTKVIEIFDPGYVHPCMWMQIPSLNLHYGYVLGNGLPDLERPFLERLQKSITVDLNKLKRLYAQIQISNP